MKDKFNLTENQMQTLVGSGSNLDNSIYFNIVLMCGGDWDVQFDMTDLK